MHEGTNTRRWLALLLLVAAGDAMAAGGHHGVDDAGILPPGRCEQESWASRAQGGERLLHAGANCRVGPLELGVAAEHARAGGASQTGWNLEAKWAHEVADGWSIGIDLQPVWQAHVRPRQASTRFAALATWAPHADYGIHLNLGRDFVRGGRDLPHHGVGIDWTPADGWTFTAERFLEQEAHFLRGGVRFASGRWSVDFSRAQRISGPGVSNWTLGLTLAFGDD